jgi:hypothetical protein
VKIMQKKRMRMKMQILQKVMRSIQGVAIELAVELQDLYSLVKK